MSYNPGVGYCPEYGGAPLPSAAAPTVSTGSFQVVASGGGSFQVVASGGVSFQVVASGGGSCQVVASLPGLVLV